MKEGETIFEAAIRETGEEIGVTPKSLEKVAILHFYHPDDPQKEGFNQDVHVFFARDWEGDITETEEMRPSWFEISDISYPDMWDDDIYWLPNVLRGRKIKGKFGFDDNNKVSAYIIEDYVEES